MKKNIRIGDIIKYNEGVQDGKVVGHYVTKKLISMVVAKDDSGYIHHFRESNIIGKEK